MKADKSNIENIDFLTKLYNRKFFLEYSEYLIDNKIEFSVFVIDLNSFKLVNDVHGHDVGDAVLMEVARRFMTLENDDLIFSRLGGDEFALLFKSIDADEINNVGKKINSLFDDTVNVSESEFSISASIGVSRYPIDSDNLSYLLKLADLAMYSAKKSGISDKYLISNELNEKLAKRKKIEDLLKNIDVEKELFLEYQPFFDLESDELLGVEALVRWRHAEEGVIYPNDFIYIAEEIDIVKDVTRWVFINALQQIKEWNDKYSSELKISLNVANSCIHNKIFFGNMKFMFDEFKINPNLVCLELTELSISVSPEYMKKLLSAINDMGVSIYLDDFGTGYIKITDLKYHKIKAIKIDNVHIQNLDDNEVFDVVKSMILLAHGLGIKAIAEGVETKDQYEILKKLGCDNIQGFYKEKPLSKEAFEKKYLSSM